MLMRTMRVADARRIATRTPDFLVCARRSFLGTRSELIFSERVDCGLTATWATGAAAGRAGAAAPAAAVGGYADRPRGPVPGGRPRGRRGARGGVERVRVRRARLVAGVVDREDGERPLA